MKFLDNLKISTKIVSLLLMLGAITLFIAWSGSRQLLSADASNTVLVNTLSNSVQLARGSRAVQTMAGAPYVTIVNDGRTALAREAVDSIDDEYDRAKKSIATFAVANRPWPGP